jgi:outer membrane protein assembly factor BamB
VALKKSSGIEVWRNDTLKNRSLSAPAVVGDYVVVADLEGYVHWFDRATGVVVARAKTGGDRVTNAPLAAGGNVYLISDKGDITALHGVPVAARAAQVAPASNKSAPAPRPAEPASSTSEPAATPAPGG